MKNNTVNEIKNSQIGKFPITLDNNYFITYKPRMKHKYGLVYSYPLKSLPEFTTRRCKTDFFDTLEDAYASWFNKQGHNVELFKKENKDLYNVHMLLIALVKDAEKNLKKDIKSAKKKTKRVNHNLIPLMCGWSIVFCPAKKGDNKYALTHESGYKRFYATKKKAFDTFKGFSDDFLNKPVSKKIISTKEKIKRINPNQTILEDGWSILFCPAKKGDKYALTHVRNGYTRYYATKKKARNVFRDLNKPVSNTVPVKEKGETVKKDHKLTMLNKDWYIMFCPAKKGDNKYALHQKSTGEKAYFISLEEATKVWKYATDSSDTRPLLYNMECQLYKLDKDHYYLATSNGRSFGFDSWSKALDAWDNQEYLIEGNYKETCAGKDKVVVSHYPDWKISFNRCRKGKDKTERYTLTQISTGWRSFFKTKEHALSILSKLNEGDDIIFAHAIHKGLKDQGVLNIDGYWSLRRFGRDKHTFISVAGEILPCKSLRSANDIWPLLRDNPRSAPRPLDLKRVIIDGLIFNGMDGLANSDKNCSCFIESDDFAQCVSCKCKPGKTHKCILVDDTAKE